MPPAKVIFVCISSSKLAVGMPITMPSVVNGNGPLNMLWKLTMSSCWSMIALFEAFFASVIELPCAS